MNPLGETDFRLGAWLVAPKLNTVSRDGQTTRLEPKVMQVLICLAEAGDVVSKEKLMARIWTGTFVTDDVLTRSISELRKAFDDDTRNPQYIQTIPKGGYRLLVRASEIEPSQKEQKPNGQSNASAPQPNLQPPVVEPPAHPTPTPPPPQVARPRRTLWMAAGAAVVLAVFAGLILTGYALRHWGPRAAAASRTTMGTRAMLAVLPFQNLSNDESQNYFADGLTAEMISQLGRLPSDSVGVIAWNSMVRYRGVKKTESEVGAELGANYVLEGTVRRDGQHVRITAELVKTGDRSHIWANSYDGDLNDVLALQTRVAREIAGEIRLRLTPEQEARLENPAQVKGEAYDAYLKGKSMMETGAKAMAGKTEVEHLKTAIDLTPGYAPPYVSLAAHYRDEASHGMVPSKDAYARARAALDKALKIDPNLAAAHREMGWVHWRGEWDFPGADREYRAAIELNPNDAGTHEQYSLYLKSQRRYDDALREINRALELSPLGAVAHANAGTLLGLMGRFDEASDQFRRALELEPPDPYIHERFGAFLLWEAGAPASEHPHATQNDAISEFENAVDRSHRQPEKLIWLGYALAARGKAKQARAILEEIQADPREQYVSPFYRAMLYAGLGERQHALDWLEKAYDDHDEWMVYLRIYPEFASLRDEPRFQDLVRRLKLP